VHVDACYTPFLSINLIKKSREFAFLTRIPIQNNATNEHALEKYAMLEIEQK